MKSYKKHFILTSPRLMKMGAFFYNLLTLKIFWFKSIDISECICKKTLFKIDKNSKVKIGLGSYIKNCTFIIRGRNSRIILGEKCKVRNTSFICEDDDSCILINDGFTMEGGEIASTEGKKIIIGTDCMVSFNVDIRNGDSHAIYNKASKERINYGRDIIIKDHVWLSGNVTVLKGSEIESNSIIANSAVVTQKLEDPYSIYGGIPARLIKSDITWERERLS